MAELGAVLFFSIAGYLTLQSFHYFRYRWHALEWERNLFEATVVGAVLFVACRLAAPWLESMTPVLVGREWIKARVPFPYAGSFIAAFAFGHALSWIGNWVCNRERAARAVVKNYGGELYKLLLDSAEESALLSMTMSNRKVYVGRIAATPSLTLKNPSTRIVPTLSGFRRDDSLTIVFTTRYQEVYEDLSRRKRAGEKLDIDYGSFGIALPMDQIVSANRFDPQIYRRYFDRPAFPARFE